MWLLTYKWIPFEEAFIVMHVRNFMHFKWPKKRYVVHRTSDSWAQNTVSVRLHMKDTFNTFESWRNFIIVQGIKRCYRVVITEWHSLFSESNHAVLNGDERDSLQSSLITFSSLLFKLRKENLLRWSVFQTSCNGKRSLGKICQ